MLYLPGTNMNGEIAVDDPRYSMPLYLATHGVDVWAMDYRTHFVPPDTPAAKLTVMMGWTNRMFEGDIEAAAAFVAHRLTAKSSSSPASAAARASPTCSRRCIRKASPDS